VKAVPALLLLAIGMTCEGQQPPTTASSTVIFYRVGGLWSKALDFPISLDGKAVGSIHNGLYISISTTPGKHEVSAGGSMLTQGETVTLNTEDGKTYYVRVDNAKGMHEHVRMRLVKPEEATKTLSKLKESQPKILN